MDNIDEVLDKQKPVTELDDFKDDLKNPLIQIGRGLSIRQKSLLKIWYNLIKIDLPILDVIVKFANLGTFAIVLMLLIRGFM